MAFLVGNRDVVAVLAKPKNYFNYGTLRPIKIAATVILDGELGYPRWTFSVYESRSNALV